MMQIFSPVVTLVFFFFFCCSLSRVYFFRYSSIASMPFDLGTANGHNATMCALVANDPFQEDIVEFLSQAHHRPMYFRGSAQGNVPMTELLTQHRQQSPDIFAVDESPPASQTARDERMPNRVSPDLFEGMLSGEQPISPAPNELSPDLFNNSKVSCLNEGTTDGDVEASAAFQPVLFAADVTTDITYIFNETVLPEDANLHHFNTMQYAIPSPDLFPMPDAPKQSAIIEDITSINDESCFVVHEDNIKGHTESYDVGGAEEYSEFLLPTHTQRGMAHENSPDIFEITLMPNACSVDNRLVDQFAGSISTPRNLEAAINIDDAMSMRIAGRAFIDESSIGQEPASSPTHNHFLQQFYLNRLVAETADARNENRNNEFANRTELDETRISTITQVIPNFHTAINNQYLFSAFKMLKLTRKPKPYWVQRRI